MQVIKVNSIDCIETSEKSCAIGMFDGMHIGHMRVFSNIDGEKNVITFSNNFNKQSAPIYDLETKLEQFKKNNVNIVYVIDTNSNFINLNKFDFIEWMKLNNIKKIVCGSDIRFGKDGEGTINLLKDNFEVKEISTIYDNNLKVSTTTIKEYLQSGEISKANEYLSENFYVRGIVQKGKQLGRKIGYPTANLIVSNIILPYGVYETSVIFEGKTYISITNVGVNPTVDKDNLVKVETHFIDQDIDLYDKEIKVIFKRKIRDEKKFDGIESLKYQIRKDLSEIKPIRN